MRKVPLGQLLIEKSLITAVQLEQALAEQKKSGQMLGITLIRLGFVSEENIMLPVLARTNNLKI